MKLFPPSKPVIKSELVRFAHFGANLADAHSCFLFLPSSIAQMLGVDLRDGEVSRNQDFLNLAGCHSLSDDIVRQCVLPADSGIIGWVSRHGRSIHVSPFEHDSRTLGTYHTDQELKSFIGVPICFEADGFNGQACGVIACDSKKAFAFSKLQGKLLEELASSIGAFVRLAAFERESVANDYSWETFFNAGTLLVKTVGAASLSLMRIRTSNTAELEKTFGIKKTIDLSAQVHRLIEQSLPPGTPICRLPSGELLIVLDNMMTSFYEKRIDAVAGHATEQGLRLKFAFEVTSRATRFSPQTFEELLNEPAVEEKQFSMKASRENRDYEHRRA